VKLVILAVAHKAPVWLVDGESEYLKRIPREMRPKVITIKPTARQGASLGETQRARSDEYARIQAALRPLGEQTHRVLLDERGAAIKTQKLSVRLSAWMQSGRPVALIVGGADGVDPRLKHEADECLRLSDLTLPHHLARLLLCEQLYRAYSILHGLPYHRDERRLP